jgi:hypothetical protein
MFIIKAVVALPPNGGDAAETVATWSSR